MYSYFKLKGRIIQKFGSQEQFAQHIKRSQVYVSHKLTGKTRFNQDSIKLWAEALEIPPTEYIDYFFS